MNTLNFIKRDVFLTSLLLVLTSSNLWSQSTFQVGYGSPEAEHVYSIINTSDGNYVIGGAFKEDHLFYSKISPLGDTLWTKIYGHADSSGLIVQPNTSKDSGLGVSVQSIHECFNGDLIMCGVGHNLIAHGEDDVFIIRTNTNGDTLWTKAYGGTLEDYAYSIDQANDSSFIIAGTTESNNALIRDAYLLHLNQQGDTLWTLIIGGTGIDGFQSVKVTEDGNYLAVGYTFSSGSGNADVFAVKIDPNGNVLWEKTFGGALNEFGNTIIESPSGYLIGGSTESFGLGDQDAYLIKVDVNGNLLWSKSYGGNYAEEIQSIIRTSDNGFALVGYTESYGAGFADVLLTKIDSLGQLSWSVEYGGSDYEYGESLLQTSDQGFIMAGYSNSFFTGDNDIYLIKTDEIGQSSCKMTNSNLTQTDPNTIENIPISFIQSGSNMAWPEFEFNNETLSRIEPCDTTLSIYSTKPSNSFILFPNPSSGEINISVENAVDFRVEIRDIQGKLIAKESILGQSAWMKLNVLPGMYFVSIESNGVKSETKRIIIE